MKPKLSLIWILTALLLAHLLPRVVVADPPTAPVVIDGWNETVELQERPDGSMVYLLTDPDGGQRELSPLQFAKQHYRREQSRSVINRLFNITSPIGIAWVTLGLLGQALFTGRMLVQWLVSERNRRSTVPVAFWWMSLLGASMLLAYFCWRQDIVGIIGQGLGWVIYVRNLVMIHARSGHVDTGDDPDPEASLEGGS